MSHNVNATQCECHTMTIVYTTSLLSLSHSRQYATLHTGTPLSALPRLNNQSVRFPHITCPLSLPFVTAKTGPQCCCVAEVASHITGIWTSTSHLASPESRSFHSSSKTSSIVRNSKHSRNSKNGSSEKPGCIGIKFSNSSSAHNVKHHQQA